MNKLKNAFPFWKGNEAYEGIEWQNINWMLVRKYTRRLENSIAKAVEYHDFNQVSKLA